MAGAEHRPVLFDEALDGLSIRRDGIYVDGTFGRGGHAGAILQQLGEQGRLIAFDKDPEAIAHAIERFGDDIRFQIVADSFATLPQVIAQQGLVGRLDGILLDLGVSSPQLDDAARGFSFRFDGPLDMRMNPLAEPSAAEWIAGVKEQELAQVLKEYGEERYAKRIARAIVDARKECAIATTGQLADIIRKANPAWERHIDPATRSFQAIRIFINRELDDLQQCLEQVPALLAAGGRLVVISFHSLEDRIVKQFIQRQSRGPDLPRGLPLRQDQIAVPPMRAVGRAVRASEQEIEENPRSRSATMRIAEKV